MLSERSLLLSGFNLLESANKLCDTASISAATGTIASTVNTTPSIHTASTTPTKNIAYIYLESPKIDELSTQKLSTEFKCVKDVTMDSSPPFGNPINNANINSFNSTNNGSISHNNNNNNNNNNNDNSICNINEIINNITHYNQQQHKISSGNIKSERLSPNTTNGDFQSKLTRSRSSTPSSFRSTPPPATTVSIHNLSTQLLNSIQQPIVTHKTSKSVSGVAANTSTTIPTDFNATRNYSNFMRSLAAKYNNGNPNESSSRRSAFFDSSTSGSATLPSSSSGKIASSSSSIDKFLSPIPLLPKPLVNKEQSSMPIFPPPPSISPSEAAAAAVVLKSQVAQNQMVAAAAAAAVSANNSNVSPLMASILSSLRFPPLIDMSSTQALVTLARAAKEAEIQNILCSIQNSKLTSSKTNSLARTNLNIAIQQAAQFITPALIQSAQMQQGQIKTQYPITGQSSPRQSVQTISRSSINDRTITSTPLDLSSQPTAAKRFKAESTSSQSSESDIRRISFTTVSPSPSPSEKLCNIPMDMNTALVKLENSTLGLKASQCQSQSDEVNSWTVDDVCNFVGEIGICVEYVQNFRDQQIDGVGLPLLTEDHLVNSLGMKLGPALKLRSMLSKKLGGPCPCVACNSPAQHLMALKASGTGISATLTATPMVSESSLSIEYNDKNDITNCEESTSTLTNSNYSTKNTIYNNIDRNDGNNNDCNGSKDCNSLNNVKNTTSYMTVESNSENQITIQRPDNNDNSFGHYS